MSHSHAQSSRLEPMEVDHSRGKKFRGPNHYKYSRINSANPTQILRQVNYLNSSIFGHINRDCIPNDKS